MTSKTQRHSGKRRKALSAQERVDLINRVARWCYDNTESWQEQYIGVGLAYLFWAIAANDGQPFDTSVMPDEYVDLVANLKSNPNGLWNEICSIGAIV
jgi:hypothetical protein